MTTFDERENAAENRFAHDEAIRFAARARGIHRLGLWVAGQLGQSASQAEELAQELIRLQVVGADGAAISALLVSRAAAAGVSMDASVIRERMDAFVTEALQDTHAA